MTYSLKVDFSRRFGKTIGFNQISTYQLKKELEKCEDGLSKRKLVK